MMLDEILEHYEDASFIKFEGFDSAILGVDESRMVLIYSYKRCIDILISDGMDEIDAIEYMEYNVAGCYLGEDTPVICRDLMFEN